jgi:hypothetical protein
MTGVIPLLPNTPSWRGQLNVTLSDHPSTSVQSLSLPSHCHSRPAYCLTDTTHWETDNYSNVLSEGNAGRQNSNHTLKPHAALPSRPNSYACRHPARTRFRHQRNSNRKESRTEIPEKVNMFEFVVSRRPSTSVPGICVTTRVPGTQPTCHSAEGIRHLKLQSLFTS